MPKKLNLVRQIRGGNDFFNAVRRVSLSNYRRQNILNIGHGLLKFKFFIL